MVFVVFITAFASGCGGGGGGSAMDDDGAVMMCTEGQVGTYPDCMAPGPTDEKRIADAQDDLDDIVDDAIDRALAARSAAAAVQAHDDATPDQITRALALAVEAQDLLTEIEDAKDTADAATMPEDAESALAEAQAARGDLISAQSSVGSILSAANAVASARRQRQASEAALTNNSSLIKHMRDNKLLSDAVLDTAALTAGSIVVGPAGNSGPSSGNPRTPCVAPCAEYPADIGTGANRKIGQRTVLVQGLTSNSKTPKLSGTGRLSNGFDLKNEGGTTFVNAYTDISKERRVRNKVAADETDTLHDDRYDYKPDTDYLLAGIWLTVDNGNLSDSRITAFTYGGQPIIATSNFCSGNENSGQTTSTSGTTITNRLCGDTTGFDRISGFVKDGEDVTATYKGDANGAYLAGGETGYFRATVELTAEFQNPTGTGTDGEGSIEGAVTNITAGGQSMAGSIELQKQTFDNDTINAAFEAGVAIGVVDGKSFSGAWKGQFFGLRYKKESPTTVTAADTPTDGVTTRTITTTYSSQHPGSVAGTFYVLPSKALRWEAPPSSGHSGRTGRNRKSTML